MSKGKILYAVKFHLPFLSSICLNKRGILSPGHPKLKIQRPPQCDGDNIDLDLSRSECRCSDHGSELSRTETLYWDKGRT